MLNPCPINSLHGSCPITILPLFTSLSAAVGAVGADGNDSATFGAAVAHKNRPSPQPTAIRVAPGDASIRVANGQNI